MWNRTGLALITSKPHIYAMAILMWALWMVKTYHACQWQSQDAACKPASQWMESNKLTSESLNDIGKMITYRYVEKVVRFARASQRLTGS